MMKAYGYLRVSGAGQIDGNGFDRQKKAISEFAKKSQLEIVHFYQEQVSGVKGEEDREVFKQMVSEILRNGVRTIVVEGLDRLAREYRIQEQLIIYLASKGISLVDARTGEDVTMAIGEDPMRKAMIQMQGIFAELEKSLLVKKLKIARENIRKNNKKCEGRKGWNDQPEKRDMVLQAIRGYRKKPKGRKRMTFREVAEELKNMISKDNVYSSLTGKSWSGPMVQNFIQRYDKK